MQINLSSDQYSIVSSGQAFLFGVDANLKIDIVSDSNFEFSVVLEFQQDSSNEQRLEQKNDGNVITLTCHNFHDEGTGLTKPMKLARIDGKNLFLMFWSYVEGEADRKSRNVKYTIFMSKNVGENVDGE